MSARQTPDRSALLRKALRHTHYNTYLACAWSWLIVVSAFGRYRMSAKPSDTLDFEIYAGVLVAVWIGMIAMAVRARLQARRIVNGQVINARLAA